MTSNHLGVLDAPLVFSLIKRRDATSLVAKKHQRNPFFRWVVNKAGGIWINRQQVDFQAIRASHEFVKNGGLLGIAPEGTRSSTGALIEPKTGVAFLASKADVPIVPIAIIGTQNAGREILRLARPEIEVRFGQPFRLPNINRKDRESAMKRNTDEIMCHIAALLPPEYRGVYADHPRLKELLAEAASSDFQ
jgi:1-acyl-sn-glycerol-3-phosphate acyltransferase